MEKIEEITDFTLLYDGLFWLQYGIKFSRMPISIPPSELALLFEQEGIDMKTPHAFFDDTVSYNFKKAILLVSDSYSFIMFDEDNQNISPVHCTVKR